MDLKVCKNCDLLKPLSYFIKNEKGYLGRKNICKDCRLQPKKNEKERKERKSYTHKLWREKNRPRKTIDLPYKLCGCCKKTFPKTLEYFRKRSDNDNFRSDCITCFDEKARKRHLEFYKNNTEKEKERFRISRIKFRDKINKKNKEYRICNLEKYVEKDRVRTQKLTDSLVRNRIKIQTGLSSDEITKELIETKRLITQLKRTLKNK